MEKSELLQVEKTFYGVRLPKRESVAERLKAFNEFYSWLQKQYPKGEDYEPERQALLQVEYRLYWNFINEVLKVTKDGGKVNFVELSSNWSKAVTKIVYILIDWHKANITKKGGLLQVDRATLEEYSKNLATVLDELADVDFYQKMYCYFQMHLNGIINFKEVAYPPKAKKSVKRKPDGDEPFLGGDRDMELFKSEDKQPVFWYCRDRRNVTLQQCIDEKLDLRLLCWPKNSDGHQDFTAVLPPLSYTKESKESVTWEHTYKGETLRSIEERLFPQPSFEEEEEVIGVDANGEEIKRDVADEVDLTFLNIQDGKDLLKG